MAAGLDIRIRVWRLTEFSDDEVGGAEISGSILFDDLDARLQALKPSPLLLQQGLEVESLFRLLVLDSSNDYREFDEVEVVWPETHKYCGDRFQIRKIQEDALHPFDRRSFVEMTVSKMKYSRSNILGEA
jgi:hypothetical protein